jgi:hypothetical protein
MTPEEREALLASYALGTLSAPDADDAERLIQADAEAADEFERYQEIAELIALGAPVAQPPTVLRQRVLEAARRRPARRRRWRVPIARILPAASMAAIVAIVSVWAFNMQQELNDLREDSALLTSVVEANARQVDRLAAQPDSQRDISLLSTQIKDTQTATSIVLDPESESHELLPTDAAHGATGSYTWSASADACVVVLRNLPPIGLLDVYRVTLMDRWGNPIATQSIVPSGTGETMALIPTPAGAWPQGVVVFATNQASENETPDGNSAVVLQLLPN